MKRIILFLLVCLALPTITTLQAQIADPETRLIISEHRTIRFGRENTNYMELTNVGDTAINLSNFEAGMLDGLDQKANEDRRAVLPDTLLQPGASFVIAHISDYNDNYGDPYQGTQRDILKEIDFPVYMDEDIPGPQGGLDSIHPMYPDFFGSGAYNKGWYLEYQQGGEGVIVDAIHNAENIRDMPQRAIAGVPEAWTYYLIVRKTTVTQGNPDWDNSRGNSPEDSEWQLIPYRNILKGGDGGVFARYFTTVGHHGDATLDEATVSSSSVDIDWENQSMTVPWGIYTDSLPDYFDLGGGIAWHYNHSAEFEDSTHRIVVSDDTLTLYAVGDQLEQIDFALQQAAPAEDMNLVFPKNKHVYNRETDLYNWNTPFYVTQNHPEMDSIGDIGFELRVDSLFQHLEKAPNATWEIEWVDDQERVDLKWGDILKVTASDGSTKDYFLSVDTVPAPSHNAHLSSITWPDAPDHVQQNPEWRHDTLPDFDPGRLTYQIKVPYTTETVPALVAEPEDLNAQIDVERASTLAGPVEDRTTTFAVAAEDDTTTMEYKVIFTKDKPEELVQKFEPHPIITKIVYRCRGSNNFLQITNPGNQSLDLSDYMIGLGNGAMTPADVIQRPLNSYNEKYFNYIPGYDYQSELEWQANPGIVEKDLEVDPVIAPGESFVLGKVDKGKENRREGIRECDVIFNASVTEEELADPSIPEEYRLKEGTKVFFVGSDDNSVLQKSAWMNSPIILFKITNDSIKAGTKPIGDPGDFKVVDVFGDYAGSDWSPGADTLGMLDNKWDIERKPQYWENDSLPGVLGSWAETDSASEWNCYSRNYYKDIGVGQPGMVETLGYHAMDPVFVYISTVSSYVYKVSDGYESPQSIKGVENDATVASFMANLNKAYEGQYLDVMGKTGEDLVEQDDTLKVTSADSSNVTKYAITLGGLSSDAVLTSTEYTIDYEGAEGSVSGIPFGTSIKEVLNNVTKPEKAVLNVLDTSDNLVPLQRRNFDTVLVNTQACGYLFFEVIAEDGTEITYELQLDVGDDEAYLLSDVYEVDQGLQLVSLIPQGTNVKTFFQNLRPNKGASVKLLNKAGAERTQGNVRFDDEVVVTSADSSTQKIYYLNFREEQAGSDAYVVSETLGVDQTLREIWGIEPGSELSVFLGLITPAPEATVAVMDSDSSLVESGNLDMGYILKVTSGDSSTVNYYDLYFSEEKPGTGAYVTSDELTVDSEAMDISGIQPEMTYEDFMAAITPAPKATVVVLDADGNPVESGTIGEGFTLQVTSGDGNTQVEYSLTLVDVGIEPGLENFEIQVYPNPATNHLLIKGLSESSKVVVRNVFGMTVKVVNTSAIQNGYISIQELPSGIYLINIENEDSRSNVVRFIKE